MSTRGGRLRRALCRWEFHGRLYVDGAMYHSAKRCGYCHQWVDPAAGFKVDSERDDWASGRLRWHTDPPRRLTAEAGITVDTHTEEKP